MDCVVKWRIKEKGIIEKLIELEHIMYKEKYKIHQSNNNISYWVENKLLKSDSLKDEENEQWRYM